MKLSLRIFLGYFLVVALAGIFLLLSVRDELRPAMRQSMEEAMVDTANLLADLVARDFNGQMLDTNHFAGSMHDYLARKPAATIWGLSKNHSSMHIYITNAQGIVLYDSQDSGNLGKDYSQWNDVQRTLSGQYGARSTRSDPGDPSSSTMYVAAPIRQDGKIIGVLTVAKSTLSIMPFIELSQNHIARAGLGLFVVALVLGWLFSQLTARSARRLAAYAHRVSRGERATLPRLIDRELAQLGNAMEQMRATLDGKEYVERYVHHLTHEIKSPLSGIAAASELLMEEMAPEDRSRFISNIRDDAARIQNVIDRLLDLAQLEQRQSLDQHENIRLVLLTDEVIAAHTSIITQKALMIDCDIKETNSITGDPFLIRQAIHNVLDNAMDFSLSGATITIRGHQEEKSYILTIIDHGPGIPDYAQTRIFERFYSLPRPDTGRKGTGLGLSFVQEIMALHSGHVEVKSTSSGCTARLSFPLHQNH